MRQQKKSENFYRDKNLLQQMIVACTGHAEEEYILKAWRYSIDEVVLKPINTQAI